PPPSSGSIFYFYSKFVCIEMCIRVEGSVCVESVRAGACMCACVGVCVCVYLHMKMCTERLHVNCVSSDGFSFFLSFFIFIFNFLVRPPSYPSCLLLWKQAGTYPFPQN